MIARLIIRDTLWLSRLVERTTFLRSGRVGGPQLGRELGGDLDVGEADDPVAPNRERAHFSPR